MAAIKKKTPSSTSRRRNLLLLGLVGFCWLWTLLRTNIQIYNHEKQSIEDVAPVESTTRQLHRTDWNHSSAGCLLVMDDNHRLVEWLAYHHFAMNLRYLVVAVDPRSTTSPQPILDRYSDLTYQIWTDEDYMGSRVFDKRQRLGELKRKQLTMVHRVRQKAFYQFCLEHLDRQNARGWTLLVDVDEFYVARNDKVDEANQIMSTPGGLYDFVQETAQKAQSNKDDAEYEQFTSPCIEIPRLLFGAQEHQEDAATAPLLPSNHIYLDTTRWFYHAYYSEFDRNGLAKPLVDLHRISLPKPHFPHPVNPHRPFQALCRDPKAIRAIHQTALLRVHHYLGTWETYSYRNDSRKGAERSREAWEFRAFGNQVGPNRDIVPWLDGFVKHHGQAKAAQLLQGAGLPPAYTHPPAVDEEWNFVFAQEFLDQSNAQQYKSNYGQFLQNRTKKMGDGV